MKLPELIPLGDIAFQLRWDVAPSLALTRHITALARAGLSEFASEQIEIVPGLRTLTLIPTEIVDDNEFQARIEQLLEHCSVPEQVPPRAIEMPICYDGDCGPDLAEISRHCGLSADEVIRRHLGGEYLVAMLGFSPGFPYLQGRPQEWATPRRASPRLQIPAGSVGIAGTQTGIYPQATPGGWQLLGRTPTQLFSLEQTPPTLLQPGDQVRFRRIDTAEFNALVEAAAKGTAR